MNYPKVFDMDGNEQTWQWAVDKYGVEYRRGTPNENGEIYQLVELYEKTGHSSLVTKVLNEKGRPIDRQDVAFYWPDAPDPPDPPTTVHDYDWHPNFTHGPTNLNGDVGPGMGGGAWIDVDPNPPHHAVTCGPHSVWVRDPNIPSDICECLGMRGGTNHDHCDQKFQLVTGDEPELPDPDDFEVIDTVVETGTESNMLSLAYPAVIAHDTDVHAFSNVAEDLDTVGLEPYEHDGKTFAKGGVCADFEGDEPRLFSIFAYHLKVGPETPITPIISKAFKPLGENEKRHITVVVDFKDAPPPPPPPPPPPEWEMTTEYSPSPGMSLLVGKMPEAGIELTVTSEWGEEYAAVSGTKPEYGMGGWECRIWNPGAITIKFLDQTFKVGIGHNQSATLTFTKGAPVETGRVVSSDMLLASAELLLAELEAAGFIGFSVELT